MKNQTVTEFIGTLEHPLKKEIEVLREIILSANNQLTENIKWNAPNFCFDGEDRITMRINPPTKLQLIFHRGAKVQELPKTNLIEDNSGILQWKTTDRAVATFANMDEIIINKKNVIELVTKWIQATSRLK